MQKWIELEPGAPLPPEVPPWSERYELVKPEGLSEDFRRALRTAGATLFGGGAAAALLMGTSAGFAHVIATLAMLGGAILFCGGLIEGPPGAKYVPSPNGRYVAVTETQRALAEPAGVRRFTWFDAILTVVILACFGGLYAIGDLPVEYFAAVLTAWLAPRAVDVVKRRLKSEAEASEQFLQASDPRNPIPCAAPGAAGLEASLPAPAAQAHGEVAGA